MFNLLKTDLRRLFKSRSFYIILAVTAALLVLLTALISAVASPETLEAMQGAGVEVEGDTDSLIEELRNMSQLDFVQQCLNSGFLLILSCIGVTLFVHGDFSSGGIKNICFARPRRWEYVLSKLLVAGVYSGLVTLLGFIAVLGLPAVMGLKLVASSAPDIMLYALWMWLPNWAFSLMGLSLVTLTRGSTLGIVLGVAAGGGLTAQLLGLICQRLNWPDLARFLPWMVVSTQCVPEPNIDQVNMILGCSICWAALYTVESLIFMEKQDI